MFIVGVENGKVFSHRDFVDYSDFREQAMAQRGPAKSSGSGGSTPEP